MAFTAAYIAVNLMSKLSPFVPTHLSKYSLPFVFSRMSKIPRPLQDWIFSPTEIHRCGGAIWPFRGDVTIYFKKLSWAVKHLRCRGLSSRVAISVKRESSVKEASNDMYGILLVAHNEVSVRGGGKACFMRWHVPYLKEMHFDGNCDSGRK